MNFTLKQVSENIYCIREEDNRRCHPLMYVIIGDEDKALLVDTGCGCGNLYFYIRTLKFLQNLKLIVVNTHNHPEQTGGNWRFSTTGKWGLARLVEDLCASKQHKYYTRLMECNWHWEVETYKITRWLADGERILLGSEKNLINVVEVFWTPGHTPDSIVLYYPYNNRLFIGDLFYRFEDLLLTYDYTDIKKYEESIRKILKFVQCHNIPMKYSAAKSESDNLCLPVFKHFHKFLMSVLAGTHTGTPLRIDEAEGVRFETRDKGIRVILGRKIVCRLNEARERASQVNV